MRLYREAIEARQVAEEEKRRVEEANRVKNRFLSWVIHELRTPVNLIYGLSDMLLQAKDQADTDKIMVDREDIDRFYIGAEHLVNLIRDVLDLSSSELGQLKLFFELIDLKVELEKIIQISSQQALLKGLVLRAEISEVIPPVRGDRTRIRQVIINILNNPG
jgi:signal transduction histidine kinase